MLQFLASPGMRRVLGGAIMLVGVAWIAIATVYLFHDFLRGYGEVRFRTEHFLGGLLFAGATGLGGVIMLLGRGVQHRRYRGWCAFACALGTAASFIVFVNVLNNYVGPFATIVPLLAFGVMAIFALAFVQSLVPVKRQLLNQAGPAVRPAQPDDTNWRDWLLASLRDTGIPPRDRFITTVWTFLGIATVIIVARLVGYIPIYSRAVAIVFLIVWYGFAILVLIPLFIRMARRNAQARQRDAEEELLRPTSRRPILYLRSFDFDAILNRTKPTFWEYVFQRPLANAEQELVYVLRSCGPVIAIGRPDEMLPSLGAARFYVSHDRWQEKVSDIVRVCQLVVLTSGVSEGLHWEVEHLTKSLPPERLILWCHPQLMKIDAQEREREWKGFLDKLGDLFPNPLPQKLGDTHFIHFDAQFRPLAVAPTRKRNAMRSALRAVLAAKKLPVPDPIAKAHRRRRLKAAAATTATWLLLSGGAFAAAWWMGVNATLARNDERAFERLASDFIYAEADKARGHNELMRRLVNLSDRTDFKSQYSITQGAAEKLLPVALDYARIFSEPPIGIALLAQGPPLYIGLTTMDTANARLEKINERAGFLRNVQGHIANHMHNRTPGLYTSSIQRVEARLRARAELLDSETALLRFIIDNVSARGAVGTDLSGEPTLTYRDRRLQGLVNELLARRRTALRQLREQLAK